SNRIRAVAPDCVGTGCAGTAFGKSAGRNCDVGGDVAIQASAPSCIRKWRDSYGCAIVVTGGTELKLATGGLRGGSSPHGGAERRKNRASAEQNRCAENKKKKKRPKHHRHRPPSCP